MLIGGHVSTRGGIDKALDHGLAIGAEVVQTHPSPPQQWQTLHLDDAAVENYRVRVEATGLRRHIFHAAYLVNLASRDQTLLKRSIGSLASYLRLAGRLGVDGVVFHPGSHKGAGFEPMLPQMGAAIREVLERAGDGGSRLIVENSAGQGGCVGCSFDEVAAILDVAGDPRVGVCLDTAHAYANGYDLSTATGVDHALRSFDELIGLHRLVAVHANDSRVELGANVDRHANIGDGHIGREAFATMLADPRLGDAPWILEVPGAGQGPDLVQVNLLRELAGRPPAVARGESPGSRAAACRQ